VSSHLLAEVEQICSHVGVMRTGALVFQGTLEEMRSRGAAQVRVRTTEPGQASKVFGKLGLADIQSGDGAVSAQIGDQAPEMICRELVLAGVPVAGFDTPRPSLEDLFVELTGEGFDVDG
jgi:ABC-2 type transport system ATP-binding protein